MQAGAGLRREVREGLGILGGRRVAIGVWGGTAVGVETEPAGCLPGEFLLEQCAQTLNGACDGVTSRSRQLERVDP